MATVVQPIIEPDVDAIKTHLALLFAPCVEHYPQGLIELRYGSPKPNQSAYFGIHAQGLKEAAEFAADRTRAGCNVYVGVNPRRPETRTAASDSDCQIAFWHFADLDDEDAVIAAGRRLKALPPTFTVTTGTEPHRRPHFYWKLEEPVGNMLAWTERQQGIAQSLDGDPVVINPSRIMRLAGTVSWPEQKKLQRGYKVELVTLKAAFEDERQPVTPEQIASAYPRQQSAIDNYGPGLGGTTLSAMRKTRLDDLLAACRSGVHWHNNMVRLVAHLAATGRSSTEILALADHITLPGFAVDHTRREMGTALQGARTKWAIPEPADDVDAEEAGREDGDSIFPLLDLDELENMPPPTWLIHGILPDEGLAIIYGDPGAGKSFVALDMALRVAMGFDWHGAAAKPCGVLYIAGEGSRGIGKRVKGWRREHAMEGVDAPFLLLPIAVQMLDPKNRAKLLRTITAAVQRANFNIGLIVIDTVSRALAGADENGQEAMSAFVAACDEVRVHAGPGVLVLGVHHSGKNKEAGMRGSTVLIGACETSIRITKDEDLKKTILETEKQKDDEEAAPIHMQMKKVTWAQGLEEEQSTLVPFRSEASTVETVETGISKEQIYETFKAIEEGWGSGRPWSVYPQTRIEGRYLPAWMTEKFGMKTSAATALIGAWQMNGLLEMATINSRNGKQGLRILQWHGVPQ